MDDPEDKSTYESRLPLDTIMRVYDTKTSPAQSETWKRVLSASEALNVKYGAFTFETYDEAVPPAGQDWPVAELMLRYAKDAEPILAEIETLLDSDEPIWLPIIFEGWNTRLPEAQQSRGVARLMHYCFLSAIHEGQTDRALMILRASDRLLEWYGSNDRSESSRCTNSRIHHVDRT